MCLLLFGENLPGKIGVNAEDCQQDDFDEEDLFQCGEKIGLKVVQRYYQAHVCGRQHLPGYAKGHGHAGQVQAAGLHGRDNGHYDGHVALAHARQHADDKGNAGDDHRHRQRAVLKGRHDFAQHLGIGEDLDKIEDAEHVQEHFQVAGIHDHFFGAAVAATGAQHKKEGEGHEAHAQRGVEVEKDYQDKGQDHGGKRQHHVHEIFAALQIIGQDERLFHAHIQRLDEHEPADEKCGNGKPADVADKFAVGYAGNVAGHDHTGDDGAGKFEDVTEPKVDGGLMIDAEVSALAGLLHDGGRKARAAQAGQQAQKGGHYGQRDLGAGKNALQGVHHALQRAGGAQLYFQAHYKVQCQNDIVGACKRERFHGRLSQQQRRGLLDGPDQQAAGQHAGAYRVMAAQQQHDQRHGESQQEKNIHRKIHLSFL